MLIPKSQNPLSLDDYRLICMYKVVAKLLVGRLKRILYLLISLSQSAFFLGRKMLEGVLVSNEVVDYAKKELCDCLLFKMDFEKAYDKVSWNFLPYLFRMMGFGEKLRNWIELLVFKRNMSVLVNGSPKKEFGVGKGLRQGDRISPFLFVLVAEGISMLVK